MSLSDVDYAILKAADKFSDIVIGDPCEGPDGPFPVQLRDLQRIARDGFLQETGTGWALTNKGNDALARHESFPDVSYDADPEND